MSPRLQNILQTPHFVLNKKLTLLEKSFKSFTCFYPLNLHVPPSLVNNPPNVLWNGNMFLFVLQTTYPLRQLSLVSDCETTKCYKHSHRHMR